MDQKNTIVLYSTPVHLNSISNLAIFITKHHPSISAVILTTAAAAVSSTAPAVSYRRLPTPDLRQTTTTADIDLFFEIPRLNNPNLKRALQEISQKSKIKAMIIDFFCDSAFEVSTSLNIPTYYCNTTGAFGLCFLLQMPYIHDNFYGKLNNYNDDVDDIQGRSQDIRATPKSSPVDGPHSSAYDDIMVEVPGCPLLRSSNLPTCMHFPQSKFYKHLIETSMNMRRSAGIIANTFHALESRAMEALNNGLCITDGTTPPVYSLGPLIGEDDVARGGGDHQCLRWLDLQPSKSVVFLCFGRNGLFSAKQLREIAVGLEKSGYRFLWVVRNPPERNPDEEPDLEALLPEGFLERVEKRGFVLKGWAPQVAVLGHMAVGGFVTHCGQSSVLEAVSFGVPMVGWPLYAEQRMNRVFMVEEMRVAVAVEMAEDGFVVAEEVERRVRDVMGSESGREMRRRVAELKCSCAAALGEGGSSVVNLERFMERVNWV